MSKVKVRFAPSPTGYLHIGSGRTALFNWLFARHMKGEFILRIEDTDKARSKQEFLDEILESLKWLGLDWNGEIYFQSGRMDLYRQYAKRLLDSGHAYEKEGALHFKMPAMKLKVSDILHADIEFDTSLIKDQVLIKSDGTPTYNFAVVVDDSDMGISHVIRGDDHISNTPKQVVIYNALGIPLPKFCHIPLILGVDRSRLSKRHGATSIRDYREEGFLSQGLVNYLCNLGWSLGENKEIFSIEEAIKEFRLEDINKTAAVFDVNKLMWINGQYIKNLDLKKLTGLILDLLKKEGVDTSDSCRIGQIVKLYQERLKTLYDFVDLTEFFFKEELEYDMAAVKKYLNKDTAVIVKKAAQGLEALRIFDVPSIENCVRSLADELGIKAAQVIHPLRVSATGKSAGAGLFETIELLGREKTLRNISATAAKFL